MPPPLPRSSTTSPGESVASAVGLPHPKDAAPAACGSIFSSSAEYPPPVQSTPSASESRPRSPADPQHEAVPVPSSTVSAAPAYLSLTLSRTSSPMTLLPIKITRSEYRSIHLDLSRTGTPSRFAAGPDPAIRRTPRSAVSFQAHHAGSDLLP